MRSGVCMLAGLQEVQAKPCPLREPISADRACSRLLRWRCARENVHSLEIYRSDRAGTIPGKMMPSGTLTINMTETETEDASDEVLQLSLN